MEKITIQNLLEAGVHFGHQTHRWNPKMKPYVFGKRHGVSVFDLTITMRKLADACNFLQELSADNGTILFVGTKRQCQALMREAAEQVNMFHMTNRWLGGTLTNNKVIMSRVKRLKELRRMETEGEFETMPNKEEAQARHELEKLETNLGGIAGMNKLPDALIVADIEHDEIAVKEANKLGIPVVAIVDSNCDPKLVDYPIPGNDDAVRSLKILINALTAAIVEGKGRSKEETAEEEISASEQQEPQADEEQAATVEVNTGEEDKSSEATAEEAEAVEKETAS